MRTYETFMEPDEVGGPSCTLKGGGGGNDKQRKITTR